MSLSKFISFFLVLTTGITTGFAQSSVYVRIALHQADYELASPWIETDHSYHDGDNVVVETPSSMLEKLDDSGIPYEVLIEDMTTWYKNQNKRFQYRSESETCAQSNFPVPEHFKLGSMGGYLTLEEMKAELDKMHARYPDLITKAQPISDFETYEGRPILWTGITGNKAGHGTKKNVLYTALHHAREPLSMQQLVYFMWYMLENYKTDPMIQNILDQTQLYFIPCVNPDGYAYNAEVSPDGGGMWRKNRQPLGNDNFGIDLNRNYGYEWGHNNSGSSDDPTSDIYRGTNAFSEPETQAVKWFCENHEIVSALNYHSFGDYLIYPWGYMADPTSEDKVYKSLARSLTFEKRILYGTSRETVLYNTNGDSDDWMFGERNSKNKIYSMTPEVGPGEYGFWPPKDLIRMLCGRELNQNIRMAMAPHGFVLMVPSAEPIFHTENLEHRFYLYPVTMQDGVVQVKITPLTSNILDYEEPFYFFGLGNNEEYKLGLDLQPGMQDGELVRFVIALDNGDLSMSDTVTYIYSDNNESIDILARTADIENWVRSSPSSNGWGNTKTHYYTAPTSITDSPHGLYSTAAENSIISAESYTVPGGEEVYLSFKAKWDITFGEDFAQLSISTDGVNFTPLCGQLTTENFNYKGDVTPVYTGIQNEWLTEKISLNNYKGQEVYFKWNMVARSADARDGIFVDDMKITYSQTITASQDNILQWEGHKLYPNPVTGGSLYLELSSEQSADPVVRYEIRNQLGQLMGRDVSSQERTRVEVGNYPAGVYFLGLITASGQRVEARKFIVLP